MQTSYDVPFEGKKAILASACTKWRQFKYKLATNYINNYVDKPLMFAKPPPAYPFITQKSWKIFVAKRLSDDFRTLSTEQSNKSKKIKYRHHLSRRGFANVAADLVSIEVDICASDCFLY